MTPDVNAALRARFEQLAGEYERMDAKLSEARRQMQELRGTASSADNGIKVTVGPRGGLVDLVVDPRTYRKLSPSELTAQVLELSAQAAEDAMARAEAIMRPLLPADVPVRGVLDGSFDMRSRRRPLTQEAFGQWMSAMGLSEAGGAAGKDQEED